MHFSDPIQKALLIVAAMGLYIAAHPYSAQAGSAEIDQSTGSDNLAEIVQQDAAGADASIMQDGRGNTGNILQVGPLVDVMSASISQWGTDHLATVEQSNITDGSAEAQILQGGTGNTASAIQNGAREATLLIDQAGDGNAAYIYQMEDASGAADVTQRGEDNYALVEQTGLDYYSDSASIYQEGSQNSIEVVQHDDSDATLITHQIGSGNAMQVYQRNSGFPSGLTTTLTTEGDNNTVLLEQPAYQSRFELTQIGDGNTVTALQDGEALQIDITSTDSNYNSDSFTQTTGLRLQVDVHRHATDYSSIQVDQGGAFAQGSVEQMNSTGASIQVDQSALASFFTIRQSSVQNSDATLLQSASGNATIEQEEVLASSARIANDGVELIASIYQADSTEASLAWIEQDGTSNEAYISQMTAFESEAGILQAGSDNYAEIVQSGSYNSASIMQSGDDYSAAIYQGGANNSASISQM